MGLRLPSVALRFGQLLVLLAASACMGRIQDHVVTGRIARAQDLLRAEGAELELVRGPAWSFRFGWYRNLVLVTDHEIAVVDPISTEAATALATELARRFPGRPLTLLAYSHGHHDHIRGGAALRALASGELVVLAHANLARQLEIRGDTDDVLPPTRTEDETFHLSWSGLEIDFLHFPRSHSDSYLAVSIPSLSLVYAPDLVGKKGGLALENDNYLPGVIGAQGQLLALDAEIHVPGHYGLCTAADLRRYRDMLAGVRAIVADECARQGSHDPTRWDPKAFVRIEHRLHDAYGGVEGFDDALLTNTYYLVLGYVGGF